MHEGGDIGGRAIGILSYDNSEEEKKGFLTDK